jgi:TonB family protein
MRDVVLCVLAFAACATTSPQNGVPDFDPKHPPETVCTAAEPKLREAGTSKLVLRMKLDDSGRVLSFKTESPKGLRLEKMEAATNAIRALRFRPSEESGSPLEVQVREEIDCGDSQAFRTIPPRLVHHVDPIVPPNSRAHRFRKVIRIQLTIQTDGVPRDLKVTEGATDDLNESALEAVRQWRFQPATRDDKPVEVTVVVEVSFNI